MACTRAHVLSSWLVKSVETTSSECLLSLEAGGDAEGVRGMPGAHRGIKCDPQLTNTSSASPMTLCPQIAEAKELVDITRLPTGLPTPALTSSVVTPSALADTNEDARAPWKMWHTDCRPVRFRVSVRVQVLPLRIMTHAESPGVSH